MRRRGAGRVLAGVVALVVVAPASAVADTITAASSRADTPFKTPVQLTGQLTSDAGTPIGAATVVLEASPYPYKGFRAVAHTITPPDGSFTFGGVVPDRNTRYRVVEAGGSGATSRALTVIVEAPSVRRVYQLRYGVVMITVLSYHSSAFNWGGRLAYWFVATAGSRHFHLVTITHTHERHVGVTYMTATFLPPRGRFTYRVCFDAPGEQAVGQPGTNRGCPRSDFLVGRAP